MSELDVPPGCFVLEQTQIIPRPRSEVFAFFAKAENLERLTPGSLRFHILTPLPITMRAGAIIEYRIALFGVPMKWRTRIDVWEPDTRFVDVQERGPYAYWHHTHGFEAIDETTTKMTDRVVYRAPLGILGRIAQWLFVARMLDRIFAFRRKGVADLFGAR